MCAKAGTRFQRYSCTHGFGHAFMRINQDQIGPALKLCAELGPDYAPDCAQGAYHDYWFAIQGVDWTKAPAGAITEPKQLCGRAASDFVRPAGIARSSSSPTRQPDHARRRHRADLRRLPGLQRQGCVTGAAVDRPRRPARPARDLPRRARRRRHELHPRRRRSQDMLALTPRDLPDPDRRLRAFHGFAARGLLPLARQGARRAHRRRVRPDRLPDAPQARPPRGLPPGSTRWRERW